MAMGTLTKIGAPTFDSTLPILFRAELGEILFILGTLQKAERKQPDWSIPNPVPARLQES